jgi:hypothetical protein
MTDESEKQERVQESNASEHLAKRLRVCANRMNECASELNGITHCGIHIGKEEAEEMTQMALHVEGLAAKFHTLAGDV